MTTLRLAHRAFDGFDRAFTRQIASFRQARPDVEVEVRVLDVPELYRELVDDEGLRDGRVDIALALTDWMPALIESGLIQPLDERLRRDPPLGWPNDWSESVLSLQTDAAGRVYGLPYHDGPEVLIYRTDLFEDAGEQAAFAARYGRPLRPPASWTEFFEVAEFFHRPDDDRYGCVVAGYPDGHNTVYDFLLQLWARGGEVLDADGRAAFADAAGVDALNWLRELVVVRRLTQPEPLDYDSVRSGEFFASGRAAMMWNWIGFAIVAELGDSPIRGRTRCAPLPGNSPSLSVYWVLSIAAGCREPELAYDFIAHTVSPEMDRVTAEAGAVACRRSTWRDPEIRRAFPPYEAMEEAHRGARHLPQTARYPAVNDALGAAIDAMYRGRLTVEEALRQASERVDGGAAS